MPAQSSKIFTSKVEYCEWADEYFIKFPEEMLKELDWVEGDTLNWEVLDDATVVITRVKD